MMKKELNKKNVGESTRSTFLNIIFPILIIVIIAYLLYPSRYLMLSDSNSHKVLKKFRLRENVFTIVYTHSVMLSDVTETYEINNKGDIILIETRFKDYGAGLPATTTYDFEIDEKTKEFRIFNINEKMEHLIYRTGAVRANHRLRLNDEEYNFASFSKGRQGVEFESKISNRLFQILNF